MSVGRVVFVGVPTQSLLESVPSLALQVWWVGKYRVVKGWLGTFIRMMSL